MRRSRSGGGRIAAAAPWVLLALGPATVRGEEACLPLTRVSVETVARRLALDGEHTRWLLGALASGRLQDPVDLEALPGAGPELRDALASAFCWDEAAKGHLLAGAFRREEAEERRVTGVWESARLLALGRWRARDPEGWTLARGGLRMELGRAAWALGTLEARHGLGLALETAGTASRAGVPRGASRRPVEPTLSAEARVMSGGAVALRRGSLRAEAALLRPEGVDAPDLRGLALLERNGAPLGLTGLLARAGQGTAVAVTASGASERAAWTLEAARGGRGLALGAAGGVAEGGWRVRGSALRRGAGYASTLARGWEAAKGVTVSELAVEALRSSVSGRSLRLAWSEDRSASRADRPERTRRLEAEAVERLARGLELALSWRGRQREEPGADTASEASQEARAEVRFTHRAWSGRLRVDEALDGAAGRAWHFRVGYRRPAWEWELRAVRVGSGLGGARVYFRRAGDVVGWRTSPPGSALGLWVRASRGGWALEVSGDSGAPGDWTVALGVRRSLGGRLDPGRPGS